MVGGGGGGGGGGVRLYQNKVTSAIGSRGDLL